MYYIRYVKYGYIAICKVLKYRTLGFMDNAITYNPSAQASNWDAQHPSTCPLVNSSSLIGGRRFHRDYDSSTGKESHWLQHYAENHRTQLVSSDGGNTVVWKSRLKSILRCYSFSFLLAKKLHCKFRKCQEGREGRLFQVMTFSGQTVPISFPTIHIHLYPLLLCHRSAHFEQQVT